ncbi:MAG TPA: Crp/Fnr family transcriptional regulator [Chloroflexia bacterium]|nr:Crp/Fnr family transcriptional regulator [Chloroflexia bacterium]
MDTGNRRQQNTRAGKANIDTAEFLGQTGLFSGLPAERLSVMAAGMEPRHYNRNQEILRQGSVTGEVYVVKRGIVAVTRASTLTGETHMLAYLMEGALLAELEFLSSGQGVATAAATATALTEIDVLVMRGQDFLDLLQSESSVALGLARELARRLRATNERIGTGDGLENKVCLVIGNGRGAGVTTIGTALALSLAASTQDPSAYTEYPDAARLQAELGFVAGPRPYRHPGGFYAPIAPDTEEPFLPALRATLFFDQLALSYPNIVIGLTGEPDASLAYLLERTDQVVIVTSPGPAEAASLTALLSRLKGLLHSDRSSLYIASNRPAPGDANLPLPSYADFDVPYLEDLPAPAAMRAEGLPPVLSSVAATLADRVKRTNQVRMYIPTTMDVDRQIDTRLYVQRALELLGDLFGGATSDDAKGVWKSDTDGLVGETVYIVTSYVTQTDLDRHLARIVDFVEGLKHELKQEAMALEVNEKLMLI